MILVRNFGRLLSRGHLRKTCIVLNYNDQNQSIRQRSESKVVHSPFSDVQIPSSLLDESVWSNMERWPDKDALVNEVKRNTIQYNPLLLLEIC